MAKATDAEEAAKAFKFSVLCESMDQICKVPNGIGSSKYFKQRAVRSVLVKWKAMFAEDVTPNYFPLVRLFANHYDTRKYHMKARKLIMKVCKGLLLPDATKDSLLSLLNKNDSEAMEQVSKEVALRNTEVKNELTIHDLNDSLDRVTQTELSDTELRILLKRCLSEREVFWILQILLRKVENSLGISSSVIINSIHPHASQMRQAGTPLERICELAADNKLRDESSLLFKPFEPMLLARVKSSITTGLNVYDKLVQYCGTPFYMQIKFDGEHFLLHRKDGEYRFFSRNQLDHTEKVGRLLSARMDPCFAQSVENCIFDGELMLWDVFERKHVGKGHQASDGRIYDVKNLHEDGACIPCMAVFDLVYLNGRSLVDVPLHDRLELLRSVFQKQDKSAIFIGDFNIVHSREEFAKFFEAAMKAHEEGVVIKKMDSLYKIAIRSKSNGCFKVKPFHLGSETLDVAVIGVDRGTDGHIQSYTVAVLREGKYSIIGKVGSGLDYSLKEHLRIQLEKDRGLLKGDTVPEWIHDDYSHSDLATDYVHKNNLQVLEIRAKGIVNNRLYAPVIKFFRDDKPVKDIDTYETFQEFDETLRAQSIAEAESTTSSERKRVAVVPQVMEEYRIKKSKVEKIGSELKDIHCCVLRGASDIPAQKLRDIIESFGGTYSANPTKKTQFVITGEPHHMKTKSVIKSNKYSVIDAHWLLDCEEASSILPLKKKYILHGVDDALLAKFGFSKSNDDQETKKKDFQVGSTGWLDERKGRRSSPNKGYSDQWSEKQIRSLLKTSLKTEFEAVGAARLQALKKQLTQDDCFHHFDGESFYLHTSLGTTAKKYVKLLIELHGGEVVCSMDNGVCIIVHKRYLDVMKNEVSSKQRIVDVDWIVREVRL